jgi:signal peptidase I
VQSDGAAEGEEAIASDGEQEPEQPAREKRRGSWLTEIVVLAVVALTVALTVKTYIVQPFRIPSVSMADTLLVKDRVLVNKLVGHISQIHRGDIVVFNGAGSWGPPVSADGDPLVRIYRNFIGLFGDDSGQVDYIKRVIGLPGDHVRCCDAQGRMTVNGVPLREGSYLHPGSAPSTIKFSIVVPPGRLWVMGDNREHSADSRLHRCGIAGADCEPWDRDGTILESMVIGRAFLVIWPPGRLKVLSVPATFAQAGLSAGHSGAAAEGQLTAIPAGPALPLTTGAIIALPLTFLERRIRLRRRRR